ncbi:MAG: tetratricopeptide repeat protein [Bryobacteraceae bacterium]
MKESLIGNPRPALGFGSAGRIIVCAAAALALVGCSGDSEASTKRLLETGNKYYDSGKYKEASIIYRRLIQKNQKYGPAYYRLGLTELKSGRYGEAIQALRRASELQPENTDAHVKLGDLYLAAYMSNPRAMKQFLVDFDNLSQALLKRNPKDFQGLRMKGFYQSASGDAKAAVDTFREAVAQKPEDATVRLALAQSLARDNQYAEAEKIAREAIERNKKLSASYDFLYLLKVRDKDNAECERILKMKIANNPEMPQYGIELAAHYFRNKQKPEMLAALESVLASKASAPHRLVGDFYLRTGDAAKALEIYEDGAKTDAANKASYQKRITELLAMQGKRQEAIAMAQQLVEQDGDDAEARAIRAALRLQGGKKEDLEAAIAELLEVVKKLPTNPVVRFNLGEAYLAKGDISPAMVQLQEALKLRPNYLQPKVSLARIHLARREFARAQQLADEVLQSAPTMTAALLIRISSLIGIGEKRTAREELTKLLASRPDLPDALYLLGVLDVSERRLPEAEKNFAALYRSRSADQRGLLGLVEIYAATNRVDQAREMLEREVKNAPANPRALRVALANLSVRAKNYGEAITTYRSLLEETPEDATLWMRLGETYRRSGKIEECLAALEKATTVAPKAPGPWLQLALVMEAVGRHDKTRTIYESLLKIAPDNPIALNNLAFLMAESGRDLDQALSYAQKAKQQMPNSADVADTLGWVYIKKNLSDDAIRIFNELLTKNPEHVTWRYHLAMALYQKGDKLQAKKELQQALQNKPSSDEEKKIADLLQRIG